MVHRQGKAAVVTAASAAEAADCLHAEPFDVLVSDIGMPGEDGYSLIRRVRQPTSPIANIPALALTAYTRSEDRQRAILAGFHPHVAKPADIPDGFSVYHRMQTWLTPEVVTCIVHVKIDTPSAALRRVNLGVHVASGDG